MALQFDCAESGCRQKVQYDAKTSPGNVGGFFRKAGDDSRVTGPFAVYLTCPDGHVHRYQVPAATDRH